MMMAEKSESPLSNLKEKFFRQVDGFLSPLQKTGEEVKQEFQRREEVLQEWEEDLRKREQDVSERETKVDAAFSRFQAGVNTLLDKVGNDIYGESEVRDPHPLLVAQEVETPFESLPSITSEQLTPRRAQLLALLQKWVLENDQMDITASNEGLQQMSGGGLPLGTIASTLHYLRNEGRIDVEYESGYKSPRTVRLNCVLEDAADVLSEYWNGELG